MHTRGWFVNDIRRIFPRKRNLYHFLHDFFLVKSMHQILTINDLKARYFKKVGLVDLSSYGGKIKFEFLVLKIQILFSPPWYSSPQGRFS